MGVKARPLRTRINFSERGLLREDVHQLGGLQVLVENISRPLKSTLHRPRLRLDLQLRGLAEQTGQARPIQIGLGDNGSIVVK